MHNNIINNKKFLILTPDFFLHENIINFLKRNKAHVDVLDNKLENNIRARKWDLLGFIYFIPTTIRNYKSTKKFIKLIADKNYDYFIAFNHYPLFYSFIKTLKKNNPQIKTIIYFEDSFSTWNHSYQIKYFDRCLTFDKIDAKKHSIQYLSWYIIDEGRNNVNNDAQKYDLCFIGSVNEYYTDRLPLLDYLYIQAKENKANAFIKCYSSILHKSVKSKVKLFLSYYKKEVRKFLHQLNKYSQSDILTNKKIPFSEVNYIESHSRCIIDINMNRQGISPRILSALANGQKVIINNKYIQEEPFFSPNNIWIINNNNPYFDFNFLKKECDSLNMDAYKIENWIISLIGETY